MKSWDFWETPGDGEAWLANPRELHAVVVYRVSTSDGPGARRIMVVTKGWIEREIEKLGSYPLAASVALPAMLVLRDAVGGELRQELSRALNDGGALLDSLSTAD